MKKTPPSPQTMKQVKRNAMRQPLGGHHIKIHDQTFKADSYDQLVSVLTAYRISNSIPLGNPDKDVVEYYSKEAPWMVEDVEKDPRPTPVDDYITWRAFVTHAWTNPPKKMLSPKEAEHRRDVCLKCEHNHPISTSGANKVEIDATRRKTYILRRAGYSAPALGYCSLYGADLGLFTILENPLAFSRKEVKENTQPDCWVRSFGG